MTKRASKAPAPAANTQAPVALALPEQLAPLGELAYNLWWTWDPAAARLFESIDPALWEATAHNPVPLLRRLGPRRKQQLAADGAFVTDARHACRRMQAYLRSPTWFQRRYGRKARGLVAYFSMEFGLHESLPIFAGGLGVLAGDHLKSASDLGLPLVGVGVFWRHGYTRQQIDAAGNQVDRFDRLLPENLPLTEVTGPTGRPLRIKIPVGSDTVLSRAWRVDVGRTCVLLLDTNLPDNAARQRRLTSRLYSGDRDTRIRQEILLGIGGWRLLRALDWPVAACHLNEGHAAFCLLERLAETIRQRDCGFAGASRRIAATSIFTTHTPISDGNETFATRLAEKYVGTYGRQLGIGTQKLLAVGRVKPLDTTEGFGMTPLALRLSKYRNGVSKMHGCVSRQMWRDLWPRRGVERVPIGSITNGIHLRTWLHPRMAELLDEYLPDDWEDRQDRAAVWSAARKIPDARLWEVHATLKDELIGFVRQRVRIQMERSGASPKAIQAASEALDPGVLTIGFARRFASYKRAALIFSDARRLQRLVNHAKRPVQIIFAGKAHPADASGKALVAEVVGHARSARFSGRVVFLEDYDMDVARHLVAGVDVWLNNPQRPNEASGTSGMKPTLHGGLNLSILDGWWPEACLDGRNGWSIGTAEDHNGSTAADMRDARSLYRRLEREIIPLYYRRNARGRSTRWIRLMKHSLATIPPVFNSHRMVKEYVRRYYMPALKAP
ncbi:MAG: alpha-glucan family phosphorylase [Phycisphaerae bacterium]|nr:alpha-glucan family phosphorylase [Phycisphaerae bacterium]